MPMECLYRRLPFFKSCECVFVVQACNVFTCLIVYLLTLPIPSLCIGIGISYSLVHVVFGNVLRALQSIHSTNSLYSASLCGRHKQANTYVVL